MIKVGKRVKELCTERTIEDMVIALVEQMSELTEFGVDGIDVTIDFLPLPMNGVADRQKRSFKIHPDLDLERFKATVRHEVAHIIMPESYETEFDVWDDTGWGKGVLVDALKTGGYDWLTWVYPTIEKYNKMIQPVEYFAVLFDHVIGGQKSGIPHEHLVLDLRR